MAVEDGVHVLLVTLALQGHLNPMLRLAKRLVSKGLHVTLATTEVARQKLLNCNISTTTSTTTTTTTTTMDNPKVHLEFLSDGFSLDYDRNKNMNQFIDSLPILASQNLSNLITNLSKDRTFSCIITSPFVPWVVDVADHHGIPCAILWIQPCALFSIYYRYQNGLNAFPTVDNPKMAVDIPGMPLLEVEDLPSFLLPSNPITSFLKLISDLAQIVQKVKWVLGNSFDELEKDIVDSMALLHPITPIGPLVPSILLGKEDSVIGDVDLWKVEDTCIEWLDKHSPSSVVYVSFGSITVLSSKQMKNIAMGLKSSNLPFLWVVKPPQHSSGDKKGELPVGFLKETKGHGLVVPWCNQEKVLAHPAVACFMSHCGWNSALEAVASGMPVIACPGWTDQPTNAMLIVDVFKMGLRMRPGEDGVISKEEVERCILEVTDGPKSKELKIKAAEWKEAARKAVADGGSSDQNIQLFITDIITQSSKPL